MDVTVPRFVAVAVVCTAMTTEWAGPVADKCASGRD